jgi:hypothetical protein
MTLVLTKAELERMRASIRGPQADTSAADRKAELKRMSNERMKNWPNTLEALRLKKESWLKDRAEQEELKRQEIDRQEAELRRTLRLESIKKANDLLYEQTDKMKLLRSQELYANVIHTRFQQIDRKKQVKEHEKIDEKKYHEETMRRVREGEEQEKKKIEEQKRVIEDVKVSRYQQREEARLRREEELRKNREEGLKMKKDAQERLEEDLRDFERKQKLAAETNIRMIKANEELKHVRLELKEKEKSAELERDAEVAKIDHRKKMLKHLEQVRFEKAQETRQKIIDAAVTQLAQKQNKEEAILEKQVQDLKDKEDAMLAAKAEKNERIKQEIITSRIAQIEARENEMRRKHEEEDALVQKWKRENEEAIQAEAEKVRQHRIKTVKIKTQQYHDGKEAAKKKQEAKMYEIEQTRFLATLENHDEQRFVQSCKAKIEENIRLGKPVYTLLRALEYHQPELLPAKTVKVVKKDE